MMRVTLKCTSYRFVRSALEQLANSCKSQPLSAAFHQERPTSTPLSLQRRCYSDNFSTNPVTPIQLERDPSLLDYSPAAEEDSGGFVVIPNFISLEEEESLLQDIRRTLRGKRYQYDHWDGVRTFGLMAWFNLNLISPFSGPFFCLLLSIHQEMYCV